jgi:hypothetical protein
MIDSNNYDQFGEVRQELHELAREETLREVPLLLMTNRRDMAALNELTAPARRGVLCDLGGRAVRGHHLARGRGTQGTSHARHHCDLHRRADVTVP